MLGEKAIIATLNISFWTARKYDRDVSKDIEDQYNSEEDAGRYNKLLIAKDAVATIQKTVGEARQFHVTNTLPWDNVGGRLLTTENYFDYIAAIDRFKVAFEDAVDEFLREYPELHRDAEHRLGKMFKEEDYPDKDVLREKYSFKVFMTPVPTSDDIRVELNEGEVENIRIELEDRLAQTTKAAMKDLWSRLYNVVQCMVKRLSKKENKFKDSLVNNVTELCALLPKLNFTKDIELTEMTDKILDKLTLFSPKQLREDENARTQTAAEAQRILNNIRDYIQ